MTAPGTPIPRIEPAALVDDVLRVYPATATVFTSFGIDIWGDSARGLRDAAREDGADCCALLAALEWAACDAACDAGERNLR